MTRPAARPAGRNAALPRPTGPDERNAFIGKMHGDLGAARKEKI